MKSAADLKTLLQTIDHKSYPAYKSTKGVYAFPDFWLSIDHVQGDPFAAPSKISIGIHGKKAGFPTEYYVKYNNRIALQDYLLRMFCEKTEKYNFKAKGSGKSGLILVSHCGQEVLERSSCTIDKKTGDLTVRLETGFPAAGRTINAKELIKILFEFLPKCADEVLFYPNYNPGQKTTLKSIQELTEDQEAIRDQIAKAGLTAFVANGSILPRQSGVSDKPMKNAVPFCSPKSMEVTLELPHRGKITGMGIGKGITLIVGGGYHGKSTLLEALELGVYYHILGDGREYVITDATAVKLRAEDGRSVKNVDISMFINNLPNGKDTIRFYTEDASGSTSQAANVVEGIEAGTKLFLIDEDTSATNFMIRDELMQRVVKREQEPITTFIEHVRGLYQQDSISSIIVAGSSGAYFHVADKIIQMENYIPCDITERGKAEAGHFPTAFANQSAAFSFDRYPKGILSSKESDRIKIKFFGKDTVQIGRDTIDMRYVEQLADAEQLCALGYLLYYAELTLMDGSKSMREVVDALLDRIAKEGLECAVMGEYLPFGLALPRKQEIFACFNRFRGMDFKLEKR